MKFLICLFLSIATIVADSQAQPLMDSIPEHTLKRLKMLMPGLSLRGFDIRGGTSVNQSIKFSSEQAILVTSGNISYLFATYNFDPSHAALDKVRHSFASVDIAVIRSSLLDPTDDRVHFGVPKWIALFPKMNCLILDNVDLTGELNFGHLDLKLIGIQNPKLPDSDELLEWLRKISGLEFLMHNGVFDADYIKKINALMPSLIIVNSNLMR